MSLGERTFDSLPHEVQINLHSCVYSSAVSFGSVEREIRHDAKSKCSTDCPKEGGRQKDND